MTNTNRKREAKAKRRNNRLQRRSGQVDVEPNALPEAPERVGPARLAQIDKQAAGRPLSAAERQEWNRIAEALDESGVRANLEHGQNS